MTTIPPAARQLSTNPPSPVFPETFELIPWVDPVVDTVGFPPHHPYIELLWLPVVGPSASWLYRRLGHIAAHRTDGTTVELGELAASVGIGPATGPTSTVQRSLRRVVRFGLASWHGRLAVRTTLPPVSQHQLARLPGDLQAAHRALVAARANRARLVHAVDPARPGGR